MKIDIGTGTQGQVGFASLDKRGTPDIVADLENADGTYRAIAEYAKASGATVDHIRASHVLEHVTNLCELMDALWEVLEPGGTLEIIVPHHSDFLAVVDPTHVRMFNEETLDYFTAKNAHFKYVRHVWEYQVRPTRECMRAVLRKQEAEG